MNSNSEEKYVVPAAALRELPDAYEMRVEIPGVARDEADLHLEGRTLTLRTRAKFQPPAGFKAAVSEFERANYAISADLPEMADPGTLAARIEHGVLTVRVAKRPETQARRIEIA